MGQVSVSGDKAITIVDADQIPGSNDSQAKKSDPYPGVFKVESKIGGKDVKGKIQRVAVRLPGLTHSYIADVDALLANPNNVAVLLFSDVAVGQSASGTYTIRPDGTAFPQGGAPGSVLPDDAATPNGRGYKPTDFAPAEDGAAGAPFVDAGSPGGPPAGPYSLDLDTYKSEANNTTILGNWKLFINDDRKFDSGSAGVPELLLWLSPVASVTNVNVAMDEDTPFTIPVKIEDTDTDVANLKLTVVKGTLENGNLIDPTNTVVAAPASGNEWRVTFNPKKDASGQVKLKLRPSDALGNGDDVEITVTVAPKNDAPTVAAVRFDPAGAPASYETNVISAWQGELSGQSGDITGEYLTTLADIDSNVADVILLGSSGDTNLILSGNLFNAGPGAAQNFRLAANGAAVGETTFGLIAKDAEGASSSPRNVTFRVNPRTDRKVIGNATSIGITESTTESSKSEITLADHKAKVGKVRVTLADITHPNPEQIDVVLVGPSGKKVALMGQVGGANALNRVRLTFDDAAAASIADFDNSQITTGVYRPADMSPADALPGLAGAPYATTLAEFIDEDPNGKWTLWAVDRTTGQTGAINGGFIVEIFTKPTIATIANQTVTEDFSNFSVNYSVGDLDGKVQSVTVTYLDAGGNVIPEADAVAYVTSSFTAGSTAGSLTFSTSKSGSPSKAHRFGVNKIRLSVTDDNKNSVTGASAAFTTTTEFTLTVNGENDQPTITPINKQVTYIGIPTSPASFTISDIENPNGGAPVTVTGRSSNLKLLPEGNIVISGNGNVRTVTLFPVGTEPGTVDVTLTVKDNDPAGSKEASTTFRLDVLSAATPIFPFANKIVIQDSGPGALPNGSYPTNALGSPYSIPVAGLVGNIQRIKLNLVGLRHPSPQDLDILLVGPDNSTGVLLMSDVGGSTFADAQILFSQDGPSVPVGALASGVFKPTNVDDTTDYFTPPFHNNPVSGPPAGVTLFAGLDAFNGKNPNGTWRLYVMDDTGNTKEPDSVIEGGVILHIETTPVFAAITPNPATTTEDKAVDFNIDIGDNQPGVPTTFRIVSSTNPALVDNSGLAVSEGGDARKMTITPKSNANGTADLVIGVTVGGTAEVTQSLRLNVTAVNDDPTIAAISDKSTPAGTILGPFDITIDDIESNESDLTLEAASSDPRLPASLIKISGGGAVRQVTIFPPATIEPFSSLVTLSVTDPNGGKGQRSFTYTAAPSLAFASTDHPITILDNRPAAPYPSSIQVKGVNGLVSKVFVVLRGFTHGFPDDVRVLLVKGDKKVALMANAGGSGPVNSVSDLILGFDDNATAAIPNSDKLVSGSYKPAYYDAQESFPSDAPAAPYGTTLDTFRLIDPNGEWKLYVVDDTFSDAGVISGGWSLVIQTAPEIVEIPPQVGIEDTNLSVQVQIKDADTDPAKIVSTAVSLEDGGTVVVAAGDANFDKATTNLPIRTLVLKPQPDVSGNVTNTIRVTVSDGKPGDPGVTTVQRDFKVKFLPVNDRIDITEATYTNIYTINEDEWTNVVFTARDRDSIIYGSNIVAASFNQDILPDKGLSLNVPAEVAPGVTFKITITNRPAANQYGDVFVMLTVKDPVAVDPNPRDERYTLRILPVNDVPTITTINYTTNVIAGGVLSSIPIRVVDVSDPPPPGETEAKNLIVTAKSDNQAVIPDGNLILSQSGTNRLLQITTVGSTAVPAPGVKITLEVTDGAGAKSSTDLFVVVDPREPDPGVSFPNTNEIVIKDKAPADVSEIGIANRRGKVHKVEVVLDGLSHTAPDDIDILLVGPNGKGVILMSDAGGRTPVVNARLTISDSATQAIRDDGPIPLGGTYVPSNYSGDADVFPVSPTIEQTLEAAFKGSNPNGSWKLYVVDDQANDTGKLAKGWTLVLTTTPTIEFAAGVVDLLTYFEDAVANPSELNGGAAGNPDVIIRDDDAGTSAAGLEITRKSTDESKIKSSNVALAGAVGPVGFNVNITPEKDQWDTTTNLLTSITVTRKSDGASASLAFKNVIKAVNDVPSITRTTDKYIQEDGVAETLFVISDVPEPSNNDPIELEVTTLDPNAVGISNIVLNGVSGAVNAASLKVSTTLGKDNVIQVRKNAGLNVVGANVPARIRITAKDSSTTAPEKQVSVPVDQFGAYTVFISPKNDAPTLAAIPDLTITAGETKVWDVAEGNFPAVIDVSDPDDTADIVVTATSRDQALVKNANIKISPEKGGTGKRDLSIRSELEVQGDVMIDVVVADKAGGTTSRAFKLSVRPSRERRYEGKSIKINDLAVADPYPSIIEVNDLVGDVESVRVELNNLAHGYPDDIDLLLVGPDGTKVMLMSDAGGSTPVTNVVLTFSQTGGNPVSDLGPLSTATVRPGNYDISNDPFAGGPTAPYETDLTKLSGKTAKGQWKLYAVDDTRQDAGSIGNWVLYISTKPRIEGLANQTIKEDDQLAVPFTVVEESFAPQTYSFAFGSTNPAVIPVGNLSVVETAPGAFEVRGSPVLNSFGATEITVFATNTFSQVASGKFSVTVTSVDDAPTITQVTDQVIFSGTATAPVPFDYGDAETAKKDLKLEITSTNTDLVPTNNVIQIGNTLTIAPVGAQTGETEITIRVTDAGGQNAKTTFKVSVVPALNAQYANTSTITLRDNNTAQDYPSKINVAGLKSTVSKVTVTLAQVNHGYPADLDVMLVKGNKKVILMSDAGGGRRLENTRITFDDSQPSLPYNPTVPIASGSYKPTNYEGTGDAFASPAPAGPYSATLSDFAGIDPNGDWELYIVDDVSPDAGAITGGWVLNIFTTEPVISEIKDQVTSENVAIIVPFQVSDADTALGSVVTVGTTDSPGLLQVGAVQGSGQNRTVRIDPVLFQSGTGKVEITANDGTTVVSRVFNVTVTPVNQAPQVQGLVDSSTPANRTLSLPFTVFDQETAGADLAVGAAIEGAQFGTVEVPAGGNNRTLVFRPSGLQGQTVVSVTVSDGQLSTTNKISVTIGAEYVLTISAIPDQVVEEDTAKSVPFTVNGSESGIVAVAATAADTNLVAAVKTSGQGSAWTVLVTPAKDAVGSTTVTLVATDEFGTGTQTFNVTVVPGNDAPEFGPIPNQTTQRNLPVTFEIPVTDKDTAVTSLIFSWASSNPDLINNVVFGLKDGTTPIATVIPKRDQVGQASVTIFADDGSSKVGAPVLVTVVAPANQPPVFGPISDQETFKNIPLTIDLPLTDPDTAIADLAMAAVSSNQDVVRNVLFGIKNGNTVTATIRPVNNATGTTRITITVNDGDNVVSQSFNVAVKDVPNEAPVFAKIPDQTTEANKNVVITLSITDPDTAISDMTFSYSTSNPELVTAVTVDNSGPAAVATVVLGKDKHGIAVVTITVNDGANSVSQSFALQVDEAGPPTIAKPTVARNLDGTLTVVVTWQGGGELEWATSVNGPWTKTGVTTGRYTEVTTQGSKIYRVVRP